MSSSEASHPKVVLGERYADALVFARERFEQQHRKVSGIPYLAHLMTVSALVLENGGDEDAGIAGLLHDAIEDAGENARKSTAAVLRDRFGDTVADVVELCSDVVTDGPKPEWLQRKRAYIARVREHVADQPRNERYLKVTLADKLHNARSIAADRRALGDDPDAVFDRFENAGNDRAQRKRQTLAHYSDLAGALAGSWEIRGEPSLGWQAAELVEVVRAIGGGPEHTLDEAGAS